MQRRTFGLYVALGLGAFANLGCDWPHQGIRKAKRDEEIARAAIVGEEKSDETETDKIQDVNSDPAKPRPFFRNSRLSGALSNEGRDIERSLGVR